MKEMALEDLRMESGSLRIVYLMGHSTWRVVSRKMMSNCPEN